MQKVTATIKIDYYKPTGKYYSSGSFDMELCWIEGGNCCYSYPVVDEIQHLRETGKAPGLINGGKEFVWVARVFYNGEEEGSYIMLPEELHELAREIRNRKY